MLGMRKEVLTIERLLVLEKAGTAKCKGRCEMYGIHLCCNEDADPVEGAGTEGILRESLGRN